MKQHQIGFCLEYAPEIGSIYKYILHAWKCPPHRLSDSSTLEWKLHDNQRIDV